MRNLYLLIFPRTAKILQIMRFFMIPESCISQNNFSHAKCEIAPGKTKGSRDGIWEMQSPQGDGNLERFSSITVCAHYLRNAVPARGRKRYIPLPRLTAPWNWFEKCSPRKGTETNWYTFQTAFVVSYLRNAVPARGRKLFHFSSPSLTGCNIWEMQSPQGDGNRQCNNW